jgi:hypothetical protein
MITGLHSIIYSREPEADRAFLRDVLRLTHVDVGDGWLIFGLPPSEVAVHPSDKNDVHELYGYPDNSMGERTMRNAAGLSVVVCLSMLAVPAIGQDGGGNVAEIHCMEIQPGTEARFEEAFKKHIDWHRKQNDTWAWNSWNVVTGPNTGTFCTGSFGHDWEDFDKPAVSREADYADVMATFGPLMKKHEATYWVNLPQASRPAEEPTPMSTVIFFYVRFGMDDEFNHLIGEFHKAVEKTKMPWKYTWNALVSGGEGGTYALVLPRANFASFNPSGKPFPEMLEEAYGREAAEALLDRWNKVVRRTEHHLTQARPDLGYTPKGE